MKRQKKFPERERMKKAKDRTEEKEKDKQSKPFASLPIAVHSRKTNLYDPLYWNDILVALQEAELNNSILLASKWCVFKKPLEVFFRCTTLVI
jgi:hypothetical protein